MICNDLPDDTEEIKVEVEFPWNFQSNTFYGFLKIFYHTVGSPKFPSLWFWDRIFSFDAKNFQKSPQFSFKNFVTKYEIGRWGNSVNCRPPMPVFGQIGRTTNFLLKTGTYVASKKRAKIQTQVLVSAKCQLSSQQILFSQ